MSDAMTPGGLASEREPRRTWFYNLVHATDRGRAGGQRLLTLMQDGLARLNKAVADDPRDTVEDLPTDPDPRSFLRCLRQEVEQHPAVNHPLLARVAHVPFTREDYKVFGLQHYALVGNFTKYLELLLLNAPDARGKQWIAKVLVDEYGEGSEGKDHARLYLEFLQACGIAGGEELSTALHPDVTGFIAEHLRICRDESFLTGLGAVGPGHEWSIPRMFPRIVRGLRRAGFAEPEIQYFTLHMEQDQDHGTWLEEALALYADDGAAQRQIRRGALLSLAARARFWTGVQEKIVRWRQPRNTHVRKSAARRPGDGGDRGNRRDDLRGEVTLAQWRAQLRTGGLGAPRLGRSEA